MKSRNVKIPELRMYTSKKEQDEDIEKEQVLTLEKVQDLNTPEAVIDVETHQDTTEVTQPEERRAETPIQSHSMVDDRLLLNIQEERFVPDSWDDDTGDEGNYLQPDSNMDDLYTLRVPPFLCNLGTRVPSVDRLPGNAQSREGCTGGSIWSGDQRAKQQVTRSSTRVIVELIGFTDSDEEGDRGMLADDGGKVPNNASQALKDDKWKKAMEDEYKSLTSKGVWTLVCKTKNTVPVGVKWILTDRSQVTKHAMWLKGSRRSGDVTLTRRMHQQSQCLQKAQFSRWQHSKVGHCISST